MAEKRVTINFEGYRTYGEDENKDFDDLKKKLAEQGSEIIFDKRNNIYCINPTMDYEMYYNYCTYLNQRYNEWMNYGFFDMGMVPYMMWPSFMSASPVLEQMRGIARTMEIELIKVPAVTFLKQSYVSNGTDYWIFREDLIKLCNSLYQFNPKVYDYGDCDISNISLSRFVKPLMEISKGVRT